MMILTVQLAALATLPSLLSSGVNQQPSVQSNSLVIDKVRASKPIKIICHWDDGGDGATIEVYNGRNLLMPAFPVGKWGGALTFTKTVAPEKGWPEFVSIRCTVKGDEDDLRITTLAVAEGALADSFTVFEGSPGRFASLDAGEAAQRSAYRIERNPAGLGSREAAKIFYKVDARSRMMIKISGTSKRGNPFSWSYREDNHPKRATISYPWNKQTNQSVPFEEGNYRLAFWFQPLDGSDCIHVVKSADLVASAP